MVVYTSLTDEALALLMNSWHRNIKVEKSSGEGKVPFLDLALWYEEGSLHWSLFQKPLNSYQYIPRSSNHPLACLKGWVSAEAQRIARRNSSAKDVDKYLARFRIRLLDRGYDSGLINDAFEIGLRSLRRTRLPATSLKVPFICRHNSTLPRRSIQKKLVKHCGILHRVFGYEVVPSLTLKVHKAAAFKRYSATWDRWHGIR